jgi:hypothetical protein
VPITSAQLEARVLELIEAVESGNRIEDDIVECKREWPGIDKSRQLAASANSARGSQLLWLIGLDEDSQQVVSVGDTDPAQWWSQISARFNQGVAPELVHHLRIVAGAGKVVIALLFDTDRAPYVVNASSGGSPERDVPVREGTRTRSAHRDELIRILVPAVVAPNTILLHADISANWHSALPPEQGRAGREEGISIGGTASVYLEHIRGDVIVLPNHEMSAILTFGALEFPLEVSSVAADRDKPTPRWGVHANDSGIICTAPGRAFLHLGTTTTPNHREYLSAATQASLWLTLSVTGASRPIRLTATLLRYDRGFAPAGPHFADIGSWAMGGP